MCYMYCALSLKLDNENLTKICSLLFMYKTKFANNCQQQNKAQNGQKR